MNSCNVLCYVTHTHTHTQCYYDVYVLGLNTTSELVTQRYLRTQLTLNNHIQLHAVRTPPHSFIHPCRLLLISTRHSSAHWDIIIPPPPALYPGGIVTSRRFILSLFSSFARQFPRRNNVRCICIGRNASCLHDGSLCFSERQTNAVLMPHQALRREYFLCKCHHFVLFVKF